MDGTKGAGAPAASAKICVQHVVFDYSLFLLATECALW